jgi:hypothetical protein
LFAIVSNIERQQAYIANPTDALLHEIRQSSASITNAENCLNVHIQRIIRNFKETIHYDAIMSGDVNANTNGRNNVEITQLPIELANESFNEIKLMKSKLMSHNAQ